MSDSKYFGDLCSAAQHVSCVMCTDASVIRSTSLTTYLLLLLKVWRLPDHRLTKNHHLAHITTVKIWCLPYTTTVINTTTTRWRSCWPSLPSSVSPHHLLTPHSSLIITNATLLSCRCHHQIHSPATRFSSLFCSVTSDLYDCAQDCENDPV